MKKLRNRPPPFPQKDGRLIVDGVTKGINETVQEQIREYLNLPAERDRPENPHKEMGKGRPPLETWQKYHENGEYLRSAEITEEQNYNMIDGRVNNLSARPRKIGNRISVLDRLHLKQAEIAKRSGKPAQQMETGQDMERQRRPGRRPAGRRGSRRGNPACRIRHPPPN